MAAGGVAPPTACVVRGLFLVPVVPAAEAAGFCWADAAATVADAGIAAVNVVYAASEQVGLVLGSAPRSSWVSDILSCSLR